MAVLGQPGGRKAGCLLLTVSKKPAPTANEPCQQPERAWKQIRKQRRSRPSWSRGPYKAAGCTLSEPGEESSALTHRDTHNRHGLPEASVLRPAVTNPTFFQHHLARLCLCDTVGLSAGLQTVHTQGGWTWPHSVNTGRLSGFSVCVTIPLAVLGAAGSGVCRWSGEPTATVSPCSSSLRVSSSGAAGTCSLDQPRCSDRPGCSSFPGCSPLPLLEQRLSPDQLRGGGSHSLLVGQRKAVFPAAVLSHIASSSVSISAEVTDLPALYPVHPPSESSTC